MLEENGTVIIRALGIARQDFPITLIGARVDVYKASRADDAKKRDTPGDPVATGTTESDGRCRLPLVEGDYRARATFADAHGWSEQFHVSEGDTIDVTTKITTMNWLKVSTSLGPDKSYAQYEGFDLHYKRPTYVKFERHDRSQRPPIAIGLVASGAFVRSLRLPTASNDTQPLALFSVEAIAPVAHLRSAAAPGNKPPAPPVSPDEEGIIVAGVAQRDVTPVEGDVSVSLKRSASFETDDLALWSIIRRANNAISFDRYMDFMNWIFCGDTRKDSVPAGSLEELQFLDGKRFLPFTDTDAYRNIKAATEAFLMANSCIYDPEGKEISYIADHVAINPADLSDPQDLIRQYIGTEKILPYLAVIRAKLQDERIKELGIGDPKFRLGDQSTWPTSPGSDSVAACYGVLREKLSCPCLLELIWSYWNEEGMLVQTMNVIMRRFQNMRAPQANDPLANLEIDPLRPLNNLIWGWVQDEQHRLSVVRRNYEYDHHYGLRLAGKAVDSMRTADSRSKFLEAFHMLLSTLAAFYKRDDDTTMVADGFPVLNALKEAHLILSQGAHNQFGDLPTTARIEMLMQQWILARSEFREFIPTRIMVAYPEPWMDRVDAMKKLQGWTDTSVLHFRNLAIFGEQVILGVRYGNWNSIFEPVHAVNWARYWRPQVQGYLHAYRSVTGVDLSVDVTNARIDSTMPSALLVKRLAEQSRRV